MKQIELKLFCAEVVHMCSLSINSILDVYYYCLACDAIILAQNNNK